MNVTYKENIDGSLNISIDLDTIEVTCLKHDLPGVQGIVDWYAKGPSEEKCKNCKRRMINERLPILRGKGQSIPAADSDLIAMILADETYMNREARDAKQEADRLAAIEAARIAAEEAVAGVVIP